MTIEDTTQLIKDCQSGNPQKQVAAIEAIGELKVVEATPILIHLLSTDPDQNVRSSTIYALNELEAVEAIPVLIHLLSSDSDQNVREAAAFILRFIGEGQLQLYPIGPALMNALNDDNESVRSNAVESLGYLYYPLAASRIRELLHTDAAWFVRASAAEALGRMHDEASLVDLEQAITDSDPQVQRYVVVALGQFLNSPIVAPLAAKRLGNGQLDSVVKAELLALSYRLGQRSRLQDLLVMLDQAEDYEVATEILMVLVDLTGENPPVDLKSHQTVIQTILQQFLLRHPSLQSDVKRVQENLRQLIEHISPN